MSENYEEEIGKLRAKLADIERQRDDAVRQLTHVQAGAARANNKIEQILGAALGYPRYCDDPTNFPGATEADGVCVGDHVAETLAEEAAARIATLQTGKGVASPDYEFLYNELAATQRRDRERLEAARDALAHILIRYGWKSGAQETAKNALIAITNDEEGK